MAVKQQVGGVEVLAHFRTCHVTWWTLTCFLSPRWWYFSGRLTIRLAGPPDLSRSRTHTTCLTSFVMNIVTDASSSWFPLTTGLSPSCLLWPLKTRRACESRVRRAHGRVALQLDKNGSHDFVRAIDNNNHHHLYEHSVLKGPSIPLTGSQCPDLNGIKAPMASRRRTVKLAVKR